ncbi:dynein axonemal assembly factor 19 [Rhynchophorus ferrugineus]|uniref:dynein axonemal assembly factor 19 n=1 Tax=Rhynchophorus ferrugineus TaxID=354439 RepID=UPI003FCCF057
MSSSKKELNHLFSELKTNIDADKLYWLRNDAKLRAVVSSKSYDEFRQYVDAAHLKGLTKDDYKNKSQVRWNRMI